MLLVASGLSYRTIEISATNAGWVQHTEMLLRRLAELSSAIQRLELYGPQLPIVGQRNACDAYQASKANVQQRLTEIDDLTNDNSEQHAQFLALDRWFKNENSNFVRGNIKKSPVTGGDGANERATRPFGLSGAEATIRQMNVVELQRLAQRSAEIEPQPGAGSRTENFLTAIRFGACHAGLPSPVSLRAFLTVLVRSVLCRRRCSDPDANQPEIWVGLFLGLFVLSLFGARG